MNDRLEAIESIRTYPDVSPNINPTQKNSDTYQLLSESGSITSYVQTNARLLFASLVLISTGLVLAWVILFHFVPNGFPDVGGKIEGTSLVLETTAWFDALLFILCFFLTFSVGAYIAYKKFSRIPALLLMQPGRLSISQWPLKLGENARIQYKRDLPNFLNVVRVTPKLVCQSSLKIARDSEHNNVSKSKIYDEEFPPFNPGKSHGGTIIHEFEITIPEWAPPSFDTPDRKYEWYIEYDFEFDFFPGDTSRCKLHVLSELKAD